MALGGMIGNGTKVGYSAGSPVTYIGIGQLADVDIPGIERAAIDSTVHSANIYERTMPGMAKISPLTLTVESDLNPTTSAALDACRNYCVAGTTIYWAVEVPVDRAQSAFRRFEFQGYVRSWKPTAPIKDRQTTQVIVEFDDTTFGVYAPGASVIT